MGEEDRSNFADKVQMEGTLEMSDSWQPYLITASSRVLPRANNGREQGEK